MNQAMKILIAYDGSDYADDAITELQRAGLPSEAEAVVLSVTNAWELPHIPDCVSSQPNKPTPAFVAAIQKHLAEVIERAQSLSNTAAGRVREVCRNARTRPQNALPQARRIRRRTKFGGLKFVFFVSN